MIPELGHFLLLLALAVALVQGVLPLAGAQTGRADWMALARPTTVLQALLVVGAFACLTVSFVRNDFSVLYVAANSNSALPLPYRIAAVWGGHEGSLLLWVLMLNVWSVAVAAFSQRLPAAFIARILAVLGLVAAGFLLFMLATSNPFDRLLPAAIDGRDLNPLLQDPGMVIHPPMLYMGYVGFSVAYAFATAALLGGNLDAAWARWTRPWTTLAWVFLTFGIGLGSWWAYNELGWGGWWFWDPVENASFMPWLIGTALIHSLAVTEKRGGFKVWTVLLALLAFSLSLLGTFLVRSGVLSSVHAFATDPRRGLFILCFLVVVIGTSLLLFAWRAPKVGLGQRFGMFSRESLLLVNNMMLAVACAAVLLGTLYPLFLDAMGLGKISVGAPYFDTVFGLLMAPLVLVLGIGPLTRWKNDEPAAVLRRLRWPLVGALAAALATGAWAGHISLATTGGLTMAFWIVATQWVDLRQRLLPAGARLAQMPARGRQMPLAMWGMLVAHLGVAAFAFGVAMVKTYETERDVKMGSGDTTELAGYVVRMLEVRDVPGPNYIAARATLEVSREGRLIATLHPEKRIYRVQQNPMTEAAVDSNALRDIYISMGERLPSGEWVLRVQYKPFIVWIWAGCLIMMLGGVLALSDRRYRQRKPVQELEVIAQAGAQLGAKSEQPA
ncbi:heme lyase CcmF/NrfE family subunit [Paucibacter sp. KCTC 42545]|uniref:heme lyase CcmF/NrfE family subunit n=1 Tax=Paucibacter sp. KCTC 42545 TaxID=1768242 RepID=UPI000733A638|nr:heme lyase CcmF/NrfE family subunit [Paucibacter sp. KCTC 42545]ALT78866.1 cytochrome C biogenesis protein [Paucibacter sp. KCTC 42545]